MAEPITIADRPSIPRSPALLIVGALAVVLAAGVAVSAYRMVTSGADRPEAQGEAAAKVSGHSGGSAAADPEASVQSSPTASTASQLDGEVLFPDEAADEVPWPVDDAVAVLRGAGLVVELGDIGCSNSVEPGFVRRVTLGAEQDQDVLFGKSSDDVDAVARGRVARGDLVTVWTPSSFPC